MIKTYLQRKLLTIKKKLSTKNVSKPLKTAIYDVIKIITIKSLTCKNEKC